MEEAGTTAAVQQYLEDLAEVRGDSPAGPIVRSLLTRAVGRLNGLCMILLHRNYPRLTQAPLNLQAEELLSAVVERLLKSIEKTRPQTVRQFFAQANQHIRWELNDLARRLDNSVCDSHANASARGYGYARGYDYGHEQNASARPLLRRVDVEYRELQENYRQSLQQRGQCRAEFER